PGDRREPPGPALVHARRAAGDRALRARGAGRGPGHPRPCQQPAGEPRAASVRAAAARRGDRTVRTAALRAGALALLAAQLGGCGGLLHSNAQPEQTYYLRAPGAGPPAPAAAAVVTPDALSVSLRVGHPSTDPGLDSPHIMLVRADHRMDFYVGGRWAAPVPELVEALTVQT